MFEATFLEYIIEYYLFLIAKLSHKSEFVNYVRQKELYNR